MGPAQVSNILGHGGYTEVENLGLKSAVRLHVQEDVFRLDIAMHGAALVGCGEPGGNAAGKLRARSGGRGPLTSRSTARRLGPATYSMAMKRVPSSSWSRVDDLGDVGMAQRVGGARLIAKAFDKLGIAAELGGEELEVNLAAEHEVLGQVDNAHAALAELADDAVFVADRVRAGTFPTTLGGNHQIGGIRIERFGDEFFRHRRSTGVGGVDQVYAQFDRAPERFDRGLLIGRRSPHSGSGDAHGTIAPCA